MHKQVRKSGRCCSVNEQRHTQTDRQTDRQTRHGWHSGPNIFLGTVRKINGFENVVFSAHYKSLFLRANVCHWDIYRMHVLFLLVYNWVYLVLVCGTNLQLLAMSEKARGSSFHLLRPAQISFNSRLQSLMDWTVQSIKLVCRQLCLRNY